ncbi:uncharacterized protein LOC131248183 isoform X3 [Magnolia sinica]|uniref:uncharacterized protein LOC131248183 isoform X3 n=1 Tax=Magnolia sinica TaxID=86752 RepID=UPI0026597D5D|nr:uncharacterized protein LOC131248183 isoform X3 [Magnolia sinica]
MMPKHRDRALKELYDLTGKIRGPEITPVLRGRCRIQGPVEETDHGVRTVKQEGSPSEKRIVKGAINENFHMRLESGTCNVCATPCSSCMHLNQTISVMESKIEGEFSDDADMVPLSKNRACDGRQRTASEASNLVSASSSHDSLCENAQSKATTRTCDAPDGFEDVEMLPKLSSSKTTVQDVLLNGGRDIASQRTSGRHEEQHGLECHGDNISCVTGAKESQHGTTTKESLQKKCSGITSETADISNKSDPLGFPPSNNVNAHNNSPKLQLPHSLSQRGNSLFSRGDSKDLEDNSSSQLMAETPECSIEHTDSSLAEPPTSKAVDGQKSGGLPPVTIVPKIEGSKASLIKRSFSSSTETGGHKDGNPPMKSIKCSDNKQQSGKSSASLEVSDMQEQPPQSQPIAECENSGSDILEDDVKVCDICGDTGREEMLAICSRCSDGAEHTYCMRIMLDELPEGDWLCEECLLKEDAETQNVDKVEGTSATIKAPSSNEKNQNHGGTFNPKLLSKLDIKSQETEGNQAVKVATSPQLSAKRLADNLEVPSVSKRQAIEMSTGSPGTTSPGRRPALSRENSFKNFDVGKVKPGHLLPSSASRSGNSSQEVPRSLTSPGPNSSRMQALLQSPRGVLSKSATFNNSSLKPKVKQIFEDVAQKKKMERQSSISSTRKEKLNRSIDRSMSFKTTSSGHSNANESRTKLQSPNLSRAEDPRGLKQSKEHNLIERKNSFKLDCSLVSSSPMASPKSMFHDESMSLLGSMNNSRDPKAARHDRKLNTPSDPATFPAKRGSENPTTPVKKQPSCLSSGFAVPSSNGKYSSEGQKPCQVGPKEDTTVFSRAADGLCGGRDVTLQDGLLRSQESTNQDRKSKEPSSFSLSGQNVSSGTASKHVRCQRCNEVGHTLQFCPAVSLRVSALKASAVRSSREVTHKSNKWKDAVEAAMTKTRLHKSNRLPDQSEELSLSSTDLSFEVASKDQLSSSSSCLRNFSPEGTFDEQEALRSSTADSRGTAAASTINSNQQTAYLKEIACASREENLNGPLLDATKPKPYMINLPNQAPTLANPFRISAIPEYDYIWQGGIEVQRSGRIPDFCDGIQAHLSTCASLKVFEVVKKFPCKLQLEEVHRLSSWPIQFQHDCATEDNIALYLFAKDMDSYERNYKKLLENMLKNDLALKGNFEGIELLIFPSNQLPEKSQRWNRLFFLWAVFKVRSTDCSKLNPGSQKKICGASSDLDPLAQDLARPAMTEAAMSQNICSYGHMDQELSNLRSPKAPEVIKSTSVDLPFLSSSGEGDGNTYITGSTLHPRSTFHELKESAVDDTHSSDKNTSCLSSSGRGDGNTYVTGSTPDQRPTFHELKESAVDDTHSSEKNASCLIHGFHPSASVNQMTSLCETCSSSKIPMKSPQLCSEVKSKCTSLKEVYRDSQSGMDVRLEPSVQAAAVQSVLSKGKAAPMCSDSSNGRQAGLASGSRDRQDTSSVSSKILPVTTHVPEVAAVGGRDQEEVDSDKEKLMHSVTSLEVDVWREQTKQEESTWEVRAGRKRSHSISSETISEASGETSMKTSEAMVHKEMTDCVLVDGEKQRKKMRTGSHEQILRDGFSPEIIELDSSILKEEQKGHCADDNTIVSKSSRTTERYLFPVNSGPVRDLISGDSIPCHIVSSDDEDLPDSDLPNLELALGDVKKPSKRGILPLFVPLVDEKSNQSKLQDPMKDDGCDDVSASLSLSLAFPFSRKEDTANSAPKKDQLLPERHNHVSTSLLLFGGFPDT